MNDEPQNHHDNPTPTPPPLPGQIFVRPGIDDRPDLDKALTPEDKAALARLTVRQNPRQPEASGDPPEVQAAQMSAEGAPMAAAARIDTAVPNLESSFLDLRDPMVDADGYRPSAAEMTRMNIGFALGAVLCAAPLGALNTVLVPVLVDRLAGAGRTLPLALLVAVGVVVSVLSNAVVAVLSDHTRMEIGRRTPWILGGGAVAALFTLPLGAATNVVLLTLVWCLVQIGYVMLSTPIAAAFGERIPDKFRSRADAYRGIGLTVGQLLGAVVAVLMVHTPNGAIRLCSVLFLLAGVVSVLVLPRERSSVEIRSRAIEQHEFFSRYRMPKGAPNFVRVLVARLVMTAGVAVTGVFLWYIVLYTVSGGDLDAAVPVMAGAAVASFVGGLVATLVLGPVADHWEDGRIPSVLACALYVVGLAVPCVTPSAVGVIVYALLSGCAYVIFDGISQRQAASVLPDIHTAGRNLAVLNLAAQAGSVIGALLGALALFAVGTYQVLFPVAIVAVVVAAAEIWSIHEDQGR